MLINYTETVGTVFNYMTTTITGSEFLTFFLILIGLLAICFIFRLPTEFTVPILFVYIIGMAAYMSEFLILLGAFVIMMAVIFVGHLFLNR